MTSPFDIQGRVIVVTGGLGQLGRRFATALLAGGARVALIDQSVPADLSLGGAVPAALQDNLLCLASDVTSREALEAALAAIEQRWEAPFGLINNAAIDSPPNAPATENGPFETYPEASFDRIMDVNVKGVVLCCQVFGGRMAALGRGSVINIGSIYGVVSPDQALYQYRRDDGEVFFKPVAYSVSKSALYNLTRYLAVYWGAQKVRVNTLTFAGVFNRQDPRFLERYLPKVPLGRMAEPDDYVGPIIFLLSDAARYMTGANLVVDGGFTAM
ncbi:SDR family oxidoreductase [Blastochloris tepida]|uniref:Oxidoreductase n=1 Tax=Blastochloris tepida TaxID=2233851 RepID=A0A348FVM3_9HYPH|nr:SDR family oxidoreductase [Blastochloris tepida]BBF91356.1 oxidoreductase [Blastochloris tepida]